MSDKRRRAKTSAGNAGEAGIGNGIVMQRNNIVTQNPTKSNPESRHPTPTAVDFALALAAPADAVITTLIRPDLATPKQTAYLQSLRKNIGRNRWNAAKTLLDISQSGTYDLSRHDASRLIAVIKLVVGGSGR